MRIHIASLTTETNTFSPLPTGWRAFESGELMRADASQQPQTSLGGIHALWRGLATEAGAQFSEGLAASAQPGGPTLRTVYESLRDEIVEVSLQAGPVDVLLLHLHGAMVADGHDDCEGDLLTHLRLRHGPQVCIAVLLDLHCHLSRAVVDQADLLLAYQQYPHTDIATRARELFTLALVCAMGEVRPVTEVFDCRMVGLWSTVDEPMRSFVERMRAHEGQDGILSVSFGHGFPWGDVADAGAKLWIVADGSRARARRLADELGREAYRLRGAGARRFLAVDEALDAALALLRQGGGVGTIVLADVADNPGGGAAGDSTFILERLLARGISGAASGCYWDPVAVQHCIEAGEGASLLLRIGGKTSPASGAPVDLKVNVCAIAARHAQTGLGGIADPLGAAAWVQADGIDLVLVSLRSQVYARDAFSALGLDPAQRWLVVVKSTQHFLADFSPIARAVLYVATPGAIAPDFARIPYRKRGLDYWPRVPDPLGLD